MLKAVLCNSISPFTISGTDEQVQLLKMTKNEVSIKLSLEVILCYQTVTLNNDPTSAVKPIAAVPQKVILRTAFHTLEPPALAAIAPKAIKKIIANP